MKTTALKTTDLKTKVALVTGASSGIGLATANHLYEAGYIVYGSSRKGTAPDNDIRFNMIALDVTQEASVLAAVEAVIAKEGRIDVLVNNAGFGVAPAAAEESSIDQAKQILDTNFFGTVRMIQAVVPHMRQQGAGRILNIGSVLGFLPMPYGALYSATKHAIEGYSESLDHELRGQGIRVSVIEPAYTKTNFDANLLQADLKMAEYEPIRAALDQQIKYIMQRADDPRVVAETVLKAAIATTPKLRYTSGALAKRLQLLRQFAPANMVDSGIRKNLKLD